MNCANGVEKTPEGETGVIVECQIDPYKGNACRYCKWCPQIKEYLLSTDSRGKSCLYFVEKI
jgi:hypothetical protein